MTIGFPTYSKEYDRRYGYDMFEKIYRQFNSMIVKDLGNLKPENDKTTGRTYGIPKEYYKNLHDDMYEILCGYNEIKFFCDQMRNCDMDNHIIIAGQNGTGKSITAITLAMYLYPDFDVEENMVFAFNDFETLIDKLSNFHDSLIVIDEANVFFHHKNHMDKTQIALLSAIEICRANRNIVISCARDVRRMDYAYRNGKAHTLIQLTDRSSRTGVPVGGVLSGFWFFESVDKFMVSDLVDITDYYMFDSKLENLLTFRGYWKSAELTPAHMIQVKKYKGLKIKQTKAAIEIWKRAGKRHRHNALSMGAYEDVKQKQLMAINAR